MNTENGIVSGISEAGKRLEAKIEKLEARVASLEKESPGQPEVTVTVGGKEICRVQPLQPSNSNWIDKLSSAIAAAMSEASHDIP